MPSDLAEFACGGVDYGLKGAVAGVHTCNVNVMSKKDCETYAEGAGEQGLEIEVLGGASEPVTETAAATGKISEKIEIKTL